MATELQSSVVDIAAVLSIRDLKPCGSSGTYLTVEVTIEGVPYGASLNQGIDNGDGSWTLTTSQLTELTVTPIDHTDFTLQIKVDNTDTDSETGAVDTNQTTALLTVTVDANILCANIIPL